MPLRMHCFMRSFACDLSTRNACNRTGGIISITHWMDGYHQDTLWSLLWTGWVNVDAAEH